MLRVCIEKNPLIVALLLFLCVIFTNFKSASVKVDFAAFLKTSNHSFIRLITNQTKIVVLEVTYLNMHTFC